MKKILFLAAVGGLVGYGAWEYFTVDACFDSGGAYFGYLGCMHDLPKVDLLVIDKSDHRLLAYSQGKIVQSFPVSIGRGAAGQKQAEGDNRTPEGIYPIVAHKPDSRFYRALRLGYPTPQQLALARARGIDPGGDIMIHGLPNGLGWLGRLQRSADWTRGCIAVTDSEIDWVYQAVPDGTPVAIRA